MLAALIAGGCTRTRARCAPRLAHLGGAGTQERRRGDRRPGYAWDQSYDGLHYTGEPVVGDARAFPATFVLAREVLYSRLDGPPFEDRVGPGPASQQLGVRPWVAPHRSGRRPACGSRTTRWRSATSLALECPSLPGPQATGGGTIDANGVVRLLRPPPDGTSYTVSAVIADPTPAELRHPLKIGSRRCPPIRSMPCPSPASLQSPPSEPPAAHRRSRRCSRIGRPASGVRLGRRVTASAATPYDVALMLERKLRASHPYDGSSTLSPTDPDALARWIVSGAPGYCQMFSASMTELLRLLGVPARVVEGFTTGTYDTRTAPGDHAELRGVGYEVAAASIRFAIAGGIGSISRVSFRRPTWRARLGSGPSLVMRLARWNLTVPMLMWSSLPISVFVFPRATVRSTSSSRSVRASTGWTGPAARVLFEKVDRSRR